MWRIYEEKLHQVLVENYPESRIEFDDQIFGIYSKTERQIDIALRGNIAGNKVLGIIDCKYFSKKIDLKVVESFIEMMQDVNANFGIMITNKGYSKAAKKRVKNSNLKLDILNFNDIGELTLTVDYFFNKNILGLQLSKSEFLKRNKQNSGYFDQDKSNYKKRLIVFKEGFANREYFAFKKLLESVVRAFRDFPQMEKVRIIIPAKRNEETKFLYKCEVSKTEIENFLGLEIDHLREDISNWRSDFLKDLDKSKILKFSEIYISKEEYVEYSKIN